MSKNLAPEVDHDGSRDCSEKIFAEAVSATLVLSAVAGELFNVHLVSPTTCPIR